GGVAPTSASTTNGRAQSIYTAGATPGSGSATAKVDNPTVSTSMTINPKINSTIALSSSDNPSVFGQVVTFTATVSPLSAGTGIPSGTLTFKEGGTTLGVVTLNGSGQAILSTAALGVGAHTITAFYGGNGAFNPSDTTGAPFTQTV